MRILLANKYYYPRGGADIYMIELEKLLKANGHDVAVFSMSHRLNISSAFSNYFPAEIDFNNRGLKNLLIGIFRPFGTIRVRKGFKQLLTDFNPEIVHLNNIHSQLSPVLTQIASKRSIPVVWTLHDHKVLCPRYDCMRNGQPCELCFKNKLNVLRFKCMKNSFLASFIAYFEAVIWNRKRLERNTSLFICPSEFLSRNLKKGGFNPLKIKTLSNFIITGKLNPALYPKGNYYCFVGRLSNEKGIETLLKASAELPEYELHVIGTGPLEDELKARYNYDHIKFIGFKAWDDLKIILGSSRCMVIPSECYENNPLSVIESLCLGTPVIGAKIGGIPELIEEGTNGLSFEPGNVSDLKNKIRELWNNSNHFNSDKISMVARQKFSSENYFEELLKSYFKLLNK